MTSFQTAADCAADHWEKQTITGVDRQLIADNSVDSALLNSLDFYFLFFDTVVSNLDLLFLFVNCIH